MPEEFRHAGSEEEAEAIPPLATGRNLIVTIGIDDYTGWRKLHNAVADARGVRDLFVDRLSYAEPIKPLINADATQDNIAALIQDTLPAALKDDDSLVIFFAGHGHTEKRTEPVARSIPATRSRSMRRRRWTANSARISSWARFSTMSANCRRGMCC